MKEQSMPDDKKPTTQTDPVKAADSATTQGDPSTLSKAADALASAADKLATAITPAKPGPERIPAQPPPAFQLPKIDAKEFLDNPSDASARVAGAMMTPLIHNYADNMVHIQKDLLRKEAGEDFVKYEVEVDNILNTLSPDQRALPDIVKRTYQLVRGQHVDEIAEERVNKRVEEEVKKRLSALPGGGSGPSSPQGPESKLTREQQVAARNLGMKEEDYLKGLEMGEANA